MIVPIKYITVIHTINRLVRQYVGLNDRSKTAKVNMQQDLCNAAHFYGHLGGISEHFPKAPAAA